MDHLSVKLSGQFFIRVASIFAMFVCSMALLGWIFDIALLRSLLPGFPATKVNAAIALFCCAMALWLLQGKTRILSYRSSQFCAVIAIMIGAITLAEYQLDWNGIDELLFTDLESRAKGIPPGRPALNTALAICFIGAALLLIDHKTRYGGMPAQWLALAAGFIAFVNLFGYTYRTQDLPPVSPFYSFSLGSTLVILVLVAGILYTRPNHGFMAIITSKSVAGLMARRLLPAILVIPPVLGSLRIMGERAGYYDAIFGLALFDEINIIIFTIFIFINIHALHNSDTERQKVALINTERQKVEQTLLFNNQDLEVRVTRRTEDLQQANNALTTEIREREQAEQARFTIQERYRSLVNNLPIGVYRSTAGGEARFIEINPAMIGMLEGDSTETLLHLSFNTLCEDAREYTRINEKIIRMGVIKNEELKLITRKGRKFWGAVTAVMVKDDNGCTYFDGIIEDISERKATEQRIHALNQVLAERATELETINKELESFSYSVSHDLRTPLRAIDGFSGILLNDYSDVLDSNGCDCLQRVRCAAQHMGTLIDDLLNLARVTRTELIQEEVDMSTLAHEIAENLRKQNPDRQVHLEVYPGLKVRGDPRLLLIVLENLLGNAWKFTCHRTDAHIEFGMNTHHVFYIRDNGAGFDMAYSNKLFGAFQRLHNTNEFAGTGIGLATAQRIVRKHGGHIWAESAVGQGATFYFNFKQENMQ